MIMREIAASNKMAYTKGMSLNEEIANNNRAEERAATVFTVFLTLQGEENGCIIDH